MVQDHTRFNNMANFAKIVNDKVVQVVVVNNNVLLDENNVEQPQKGINFLNNLFNSNDEWVQTSFNNNFRKIFAGIDYSYDRVKDVFIPWKPSDSWIFNEITWQWEAPKPYPKTSINFPKDREGNSLNNLLLDDNLKIRLTLPENERMFDDYVWNESIKDWEIYPKNFWTEEKQNIFLSVNNL